jgi:phospholipid N-methyltransferase
MCNLSDYDRLEMTDWYRNLVKQELSMWHRVHYQGPGTVLDLGAGCGETTLFYLSHGADKVIAVEADPEVYKILQRNFGNHPKVKTVLGQVKHIKADIEGGEDGMILEHHFPFAWATMNRNPRIEMLIKTKPLIPWQFWHQARIRTAHRIRLTIDTFRR